MSQILFLNQVINTKKKLNISLSRIKGLGSQRAQYICKKLGFQEKVTFEDLDTSNIDSLKEYIERNFLVNEQLDRKTSADILFLLDSGTYKGKRHKLGYPARGQRTLSNGKTQRRLSRRRFSKVLENYDSKTIVTDKFLHSHLTSRLKTTSNKKGTVSRKRGYTFKKR